MGKIFVVSDTWFNRPIGDYSEMQVVDYNNELIKSWNKYISKDDIVYILGGFGISDLYNIINMLSGEIHFLNNFLTEDEKKCKNELIHFIECSIDKKISKRIIFENEQILPIAEQDCILSYLPLNDWYGKNSGTYCFHGFSKSNEILSHNISCIFGMNNLKPICISDIKETIESIKDNIE